MSETASSDQKKKLTSLAKEYVYEKLKSDLPEHVYFHNHEQVDQEFESAKKLAEAAELDNDDDQALLIATLFQGIGHIEEGKYNCEKSTKTAVQFLEDKNAPQELIKKVTDLIFLLKDNAKPESLIGKLFLDAHHSHFGQKGFMRRMRRLQKEKEVKGKKIDTLTFQKEQLKKLTSHIFYTTDGEKLFGKRKLKNIKKLKSAHKNSLKIKAEREKMTSISANSGARTLFKTALRNHIDLTSIADQKANIMLSINALIITIGLPAFSTYLTGTSYLIIPAVIFLLTSATTMIIATLSTRPIKMDGETDLSKLMSGKSNLFFFGNFYKLKRDEYQKAIKEIVADRDHLDTSFINDLFYLGLSLGEKYRLLRICYSVFVVGVSLSVLSFVVAYIISTYR